MNRPDYGQLFAALVVLGMAVSAVAAFLDGETTAAAVFFAAAGLWQMVYQNERDR